MADNRNSILSSHGAKKDLTTIDAAQKKSNILIGSDSESGCDSDSEANNLPLGKPSFIINEEYAKRFEHNKKREEMQKLEEKYGKLSNPTATRGDENHEEEESSSEEDEDDEGFLATKVLDAEISATLQAIRNKDPKVYDKKATFYKTFQKNGEEVNIKKSEKPMHLRDYHRENLLSGYTGADEGNTSPVPRTFVEEQADLKNAIIKEMHDAAEAGNSSDGECGSDGDGGFIIPKAKASSLKEAIPEPMSPKISVDPATADNDPETFLSNFMAARAWVPTDGTKFQAFESDDEEEDERAEMFEAAYNLRFEDPKSSNEVLMSYARDVVAAKSVRREAPTGRKRQREAERERKEAEKNRVEEEKARLRRLKIEEMEGKLQKIRRAAGLKGRTLQEGEWEKFMEEDWDDERWEAQMNERFGNDYYVEQESELEEGDTDTNRTKKRKKLKKPEWDDDININDIVPGFEEKDGKGLPFTLSDSENEDMNNEETTEQPTQGPKSTKELGKEKLARKKAARLERKKIEELVDSQMNVENVVLPGNSKQPTRFRYREASPISFGLTPRDILMAPDAALNQFAGLKKMASFRDPEKKRKDKKRLGKKARLREWRRETFGNEEGPDMIGQVPSGEGAIASEGGTNIVEGKRKRSRRH